MITIYAGRTLYGGAKLSKLNKRRECSNNNPTKVDQGPHLIEIKNYIKKQHHVQIVPRNTSQETYVELLKNPRKSIIFAIGPAGTGKTSHYKRIK